MTKVYRRLAQLLTAIENCRSSNNPWIDKHEQRLTHVMDTAPSGSGIDNGVQLDDSSTPEKLVFTADYHHMDDHGFYTSWTHHKVTVRPSLAYGIDIKVSGQNRNEIKDYLADVFYTWLKEETDI